MASTDEGEIELLKNEIERLSRELDQASSEKVQSAQYGLVLLEEKTDLQRRCEDLEVAYENTKHELKVTQEVSFIHNFGCCFMFAVLRPA
jgi:protein bicaudal D